MQTDLSQMPSPELFNGDEGQIGWSNSGRLSFRRRQQLRQSSGSANCHSNVTFWV